MKQITFFLLIIFLINICFSQSIIETKTGEIYLGEFFEMDSTTITFQFYGIEIPQKILINKIDRLIFQDRNLFIENGSILVSDMKTISSEEYEQLIGNSIFYEIPTPVEKEHILSVCYIDGVNSSDYYDIIETVTGRIYVGELVAISDADISFHPEGHFKPQKVQNNKINRLIIPDREKYLINIYEHFQISSDISWEEYKELVVAYFRENELPIPPGFLLTEASTDISEKIIKTQKLLRPVSPSDKVYNIGIDNIGKYKRVKLRAIDDNNLYVSFIGGLFYKPSSQEISIALDRIRYLKPVSKNISMTVTGAVIGTTFGAIAGLTDEYWGGPGLAAILGVAFGIMGSGIGLIIDIPFWIYDEITKVRIKELSNEDKVIVIQKLLRE